MLVSKRATCGQPACDVPGLQYDIKSIQGAEQLASVRLSRANNRTYAAGNEQDTRAAGGLAGHMP